jgi:hypothetical protein
MKQGLAKAGTRMEAEMLRAILVAVVLSSLVAGGWPARVEARLSITDGNALFDRCQGDDPDERERDTKVALCTGYVVGVADALDETSFCLSPGVTAAQIRDVVKFYLRDHPERRHYGASSLVTDALKEKFPCN